MTHAGAQLRVIAARILNQRTMERVIDPLLADLQLEHTEAIQQKRIWRGRWVLVAGYVVSLKTIALCGANTAFESLRGWTADDRVATNRTLRFSAAAMAVTTVVLELPALYSWPFSWRQTHNPRLLVYLVPQALVLAVPWESHSAF